MHLDIDPLSSKDTARTDKQKKGRKKGNMIIKPKLFGFSFAFVL